MTRPRATAARDETVAGQDRGAEHLRSSVGYAFHFGKNVLVPSPESDAPNGQVTERALYARGCFVRPSGLGQEELLGRNCRLVRLVSCCNLFQPGWVPAHAGVSLEVENLGETWGSDRRK